MIYQPWPLVFELEKWPSFLKSYDGYCLGFFIIIKKSLSSKHKKQILVHELCHSKQFLRTAGLHLLLYSFFPRYRLNSEIEAYYYQLRSMTLGDNLLETISIVADNIHKNYKLEDKFTKEDIKKKLLKKFSIV